MKILNSFAPLARDRCLAAPGLAPDTRAPAPRGRRPRHVGRDRNDAAGAAIPSQLKLKKDGDKIVGTISSQMGESPVEAEVKGRR